MNYRIERVKYPDSSKWQFCNYTSDNIKASSGLVCIRHCIQKFIYQSLTGVITL